MIQDRTEYLRKWSVLYHYLFNIFIEEAIIMLNEKKKDGIKINGNKFYNLCKMYLIIKKKYNIIN